MSNEIAQEDNAGAVATTQEPPVVSNNGHVEEPLIEKPEFTSVDPALEIPEEEAIPDRMKGDKEANKKAKKAERKRLKAERKGRWSKTKATASAFPMVELIAEQVRTSIPRDLVKRVKAAQSKKKKIISSTYPYPKRMKSAEYEDEIELLEIELVKMQAWVKEAGERIVMLFEGRDAAGKGGTIKRFTENLNPRGARIVALTKPSESERGQWYFQRYTEQLPTAGRDRLL